MLPNSVPQSRRAASQFGAPIYRHIAWLSLASIFFIEFLTPLGFAHGNLYLPALIFATLSGRRDWLIAIALLAAFLCSLGLIVAPLPSGSSLQIVVSNRLVSLAAIGTTLALGLCYLAQREKITRLSNELAQIRAGQETRYREAQIEIDDIRTRLEDLTRQLHREQRLEDLSGVLDALPLVVWSATKDGTPDFYNKAMSLYTGVPREKLDETGYWLTLVHPDDQDRCLQAWTESLQAGSAHEVHLRIRRYDGDYRWHLMQAQPLRDAQGHITRWYGSAVELPAAYSPDTR